MKKNYYLWIDMNANKSRITNLRLLEKVLDRAVESGFESVVVGSKNIAGFGIYHSNIVNHYGLVNQTFSIEKDYLQMMIEEGHKRGLKVYAAIDVFSEGKRDDPSPLSPGYQNPSWQTHMYGLDQQDSVQIRPIADMKEVQAVESTDDFHDVFVNPVHEEVQEYELSVIQEIIQNYSLDGIVLDRVRFIGLGSDFSEYTREKFENYIGYSVKKWPEDIYQLHRINGVVEVKEYGYLFEAWLTFRSKVIKDFIFQVRSLIQRLNKNIELIDYTGSWYPEYYGTGANWASKNYIPTTHYPWVGPEYAKTGYAEDIDGLLSGFYYHEVTEEEIVKKGKAAYWHSVEGSARIANEVVQGVTPVIGSLFVLQYKDNPKQFKKAIDMCFKKSDGCMIFDLCYIEDYDWWKICKR